MGYYLTWVWDKIRFSDLNCPVAWKMWIKVEYSQNLPHKYASRMIISKNRGDIVKKAPRENLLMPKICHPPRRNFLDIFLKREQK